MAGFQTSVAVQPAPAEAGDFASSNPRWNVLAGPGGLVAGAAGVTIGRFAWVSDTTIDANLAPAIVNNFPSDTGPNPGAVGAPAGFVHREMQALITAYLAEGSYVIPAGFGVTLQAGGDFWVKNDSAAEALVGQKVYADLATGKAILFAATGSATTGGSATGSIAASTFSVTASIANNLMTVTAVGSGAVVAGATLTALAATGTKVVGQLSGTAGGIGVYEVDIPEQSVASGTITGTYGTFTAASALTGAFNIGGILTGTGISVTTRISQFLTGTGGLGTYAVDVNTVVSSTTISESGNVETKYIAMSAGAAGELVKMSSHVLG